MASYTNGSHIPQPPHSAGLPYKGLRAAIDPHQIPSPIDAIEDDREQWEDKEYMTLAGNHVPLSTTDYIAVDQGNSSPRFIRMSTWNFPNTSHLASECQIPLAAMIHPLADLDPREEPIPLVDTGELGPARCKNCRGYMNSWCKWVSEGAKWKCNLCAHETEVAPEYFCNLDANMLRLDHLQRPELHKGTVDFAVPEEYWAPHSPPRIQPLYQTIFPEPSVATRKPQPMDFLFVLEVTADAVRSGFFSYACTALLQMLYGSTTADGTATEACFPAQSRVGILTYDETVHFYNLASHVDQAQMLVVPDIDDMFVPLQDGLLVNPTESRAVIEKLLLELPQRYSQTTVQASALGSALIASLASLAGRGGYVITFTCAMPTIGPGGLKPMDTEYTSYDPEREKTFFVSRDDTWQDIAEQCAEEGIGVSMFLGMSRPIDVGTIGVVPSITGGELFFHPRFDSARDGIVLASQLRRLLTRTIGYNCMFRVRCSSGLRVSSHYGNFHESSASDLQLGIIDADKAISIAIEHTHSLDDRRSAFLQCALLYTTVDGQRRVRTCNLALQVVTLAGNVFRFADMDTTVCHFVREAISKLPSQRIPYIHDELTEKCSAILLGYRKHCAAATSPSQLVIPEAFRSLPVYMLGMMKCKPLKARNVSADVRNYHAHKMRAMSVQTTMNHLYPRLLALHDLDDQTAVPTSTGKIQFPALMRDSHLFMSANGVYLIDNEDLMVLWIGSSVSPQILRDLLGKEDIMELDVRINQIPHFDTLLSTQVHNILAHRFAQRKRTPKLLLARQNMDGPELEFSDLLVEDRNNAAMSYLDYLCFVHKQISAALTGGSLTSGGGFRGTPW